MYSVSVSRLSLCNYLTHIKLTKETIVSGSKRSTAGVLHNSSSKKGPLPSLENRIWIVISRKENKTINCYQMTSRSSTRVVFCLMLSTLLIMVLIEVGDSQNKIFNLPPVRKKWKEYMQHIGLFVSLSRKAWVFHYYLIKIALFSFHNTQSKI